MAKKGGKTTTRVPNPSRSLNQQLAEDSVDSGTAN